MLYTLSYKSVNSTEKLQGPVVSTCLHQDALQSVVTWDHCAGC